MTAMIHPSRQDADFQPLKDGDALFIDLQGNSIAFKAPQQDATYYPVFINEAAYYDQLHALSLMIKKQLVLPK